MHRRENGQVNRLVHELNDFEVPNLAVYWDFNDLQTSLSRHRQLDRPAANDGSERSDQRIDIASVMDFVRTIGTPVINKFYADWQGLSCYRQELMRQSCELVQVYAEKTDLKPANDMGEPNNGHPGLGGRPAAEIQLALDALEDCLQYEHISTFVVISGDSDFVALAQRLRRHNKLVYGIGLEASSRHYWISSCNHFRCYSQILEEAKKGGDESLQDAACDNGAPRPRQGDPLGTPGCSHDSNSERPSNGPPTTELRTRVETCVLVPDRDEEEDDGPDTSIEPVESPAPVLHVAVRPDSAASRYRRLLADFRIQPLPSRLFQLALDEVVSIFREQPDRAVADLVKLNQMLEDRLTQNDVVHAHHWSVRVCLMFTVFHAQLLESNTDQRFGLRFALDGQVLREQLLTNIIRLVVEHTPDLIPEPTTLAELIFDDASQADIDDLQRLWESTMESQD